MVTEASLIFPDVSMRPPGSDTRQQRSDGEIQRSIRRSEDRNAASSAFGAQHIGKQERECHRFARPPQSPRPPLRTGQCRPKTSPSLRASPTLDGASLGRHKRGGPSGGMSSIVPTTVGRRPRGCEKLPCTCRACCFQQRYRPRPTVSGLDFLAVEIVLFPRLCLLTAQWPGNLRFRSYRDHLPTPEVGCLPACVRSQHSKSGVKFWAG